MPQTVYNWISDTPYVEGQTATTFPLGCRSELNETGAILPFGRALIANSATGTLTLPSLAQASDNFAGIVVFRAIYENTFDGAGDGGFPIGVEFDYQVQGEIAVFTETAITIDDPVYYRYDGVGKLGQFRNADVASETALIPASLARWLQPAAANTVTRLAINLP